MNPQRDIALQTMRRAQAFDEFVRRLAPLADLQVTDAMDPAWVVSAICGRLDTVIEDGRDFRSGAYRPRRRRWWRRAS